MQGTSNVSSYYLWMEGLLTGSDCVCGVYDFLLQLVCNPVAGEPFPKC
jgi:hypothetical protein